MRAVQRQTWMFARFLREKNCRHMACRGIAVKFALHQLESAMRQNQDVGVQHIISSIYAGGGGRGLQIAPWRRISAPLNNS